MRDNNTAQKKLNGRSYCGQKPRLWAEILTKCSLKTAPAGFAWRAEVLFSKRRADHWQGLEGGQLCSAPAMPLSAPPDEESGQDRCHHDEENGAADG